MSNALSQLCAEACALVPGIISQAKSVGIALSYPDAYKCALDTVTYNFPAAGQSSAPPAQAGGLTKPHPPLLNDDITWDAEDTTGSHPPLSTSIPQQKPSTRTQSTSSAARDSKEGSLRTVPDWLNHGKQVTLTGLLKYIQRVGSAEDGDSAEIWRHIAHGRVFSKHLCDGVHGKCDCGFEHKNRTCVQVAIEEIVSLVDGIGSVSSCPEEGDISAANAAMAKVYKRTLAVGGRVWWPVCMTCERVVEVQVKKAKKEKKVQVKKEKRQVAVREPERPTITTKSGRNCNPA